MFWTKQVKTKESSLKTGKTQYIITCETYLTIFLISGIIANQKRTHDKKVNKTGVEENLKKIIFFHKILKKNILNFFLG